MTLEDYCLHITDGEHCSVKDDMLGNYYLLSNKNIIDGKVVVGNDERRISKETFDKINKRILLEANDVLISTVGTLGKTAVVREPINYTFQRSVGIIKPDPLKVDSYYLKYLLDTAPLQQQLLGVSSGAIQKCIFISTLKSLQIQLPDLSTQKQRAKVLLDIDEKITINNLIIAKLEEVARRIYDYWFVQFDFPNEKGHPYKSSGGSMIYNAQLKRDIPQNWHCGNLYEIANFTNGIACQKYRPKEGDKSLPVIKIKEMHDGITKDTEVVSCKIPEHVKIYNGDVLFSWSASLEVMLWRYGIGGLNQHIFKVTSANGFPKSFYYFQLLDYVKVFKKMAEARKTTMGHITQAHLEQSTIAIPNDLDIVTKFETEISPIFELIISMQSEITALTTKKNKLLPLLMNGQITIE